MVLRRVGRIPLAQDTPQSGFTSGVAVGRNHSSFTVKNLDIYWTPLDEADLGDGIHAYEAQVQLIGLRLHGTEGAG